MSEDKDKFEDIASELTESQKDREVSEFSSGVNKFLSTLMDRTLVDDKLQSTLEDKLLERVLDATEDGMSDGALIELYKTKSKSKTDNAMVISNIIKGMADALLLKKGLKEGEGMQGDLTKDDITEVKDAMKDIKEGEVLNEANITIKRPGNGISPMKWFDVIGKKAIKDFKEDELIEI